MMQVRIIHEAMRFPLWLHGRTVVTFRVVSTSPKRAVGKMIPNTFFLVLWYIYLISLKNLKSFLSFIGKWQAYHFFLHYEWI